MSWLSSVQWSVLKTYIKVAVYDSTGYIWECVYVYIYAHIYICVSIYWLYLGMYIYMYDVYTHICMCVSIYIYSIIINENMAIYLKESQ